MKPYYHRVFLNPKKGLAAITTELKKANETEYSGQIEISDCNRTARLDMDFWTPKMKREKLFKLNKLIDELLLYKTLVEDTKLEKY